jgi:hypothetical protein
VNGLDLQSLPKNLEFKEVEGRLQKKWSEAGTYRYREDDSRPVFAVDTPPPTVSGSLHVGHIFSYNDATYTTAFWTSLWLIWFASRLDVPTPAARAGTVCHGIAIGQGMIGLCFFGGFIGKLTPEYWSGEALDHIYMIQKPTLLFRFLRDHWSPQTMQVWAVWLAQLMVVAEGLMATLIVWPTRFAAIGTGCVFSFMILLAGPQIISVLGSLAGLMAACLYLSESDAANVR